MKTIVDQARTIFQLLCRDYTIFKKKFLDDVINALVMIGVVCIIFYYLGSFIGIKRSIAQSSMIGMLISISFINRGFSEAIRDNFDFQYLHFVNYLRLLPLSINGLLFSYVARYMMRSSFTALPLFVFVYSVVRFTAITPVATQWIPLLVVYILGSFFWASFLFIIVSFTSFTWFQFNIWQRILTPMLNLGCIFFPWKQVALAYPMMGRILLCNPMTYIAEGFRGALLGSDAYLGLSYCIGMLVVFCIITSAVLMTAVNRKFAS